MILETKDSDVGIMYKVKSDMPSDYFSSYFVFTTHNDMIFLIRGLKCNIEFDKKFQEGFQHLLDMLGTYGIYKNGSKAPDAYMIENNKYSYAVHNHDRAILLNLNDGYKGCNEVNYFDQKLYDGELKYINKIVAQKQLDGKIEKHKKLKLDRINSNL